MNYRVFNTNQLIYTKSPLSKCPYGIIKANDYKIGIVSTLYAVYDTKNDYSSKYFELYFEPTHKLNNYLRPLVQKGAKNTLLISDQDALMGNVVVSTNKEEQIKIADMFIKIKDIITFYKW
ncbi:hypothetical protein [Mycoplasma sp. VS1572C]